MIDRSKTLARKYVAEWRKNGIVKASWQKLLATTNQFLTLDDFVKYAIRKYKISYIDFPKDYQTDVSFIVRVIQESNDPLKILVDMAKTNKSTYVRVLESLDIEDLASIYPIVPSRAVLIKNVRKAVNDKIAEEKDQKSL